MNILIGADLVPTTSNEELFIKGDAEELVGKDLLGILRNADYRIFNLEVPITEHRNPIPKSGPSLITKTATIKGIKSLGVDLLTLSNNHIMDQGVEGLFSTIRTLKSVGISYVGAGKDIEEAKQAFIIKKDGITIGIYACCEHEFSIADDKTPGANPFDPYDSIDGILELKTKCGYIIVLYHGGKEEYRYPSPELQKRCRKMVDKGANLVICQHSHCIGCEEDYNYGKIVYGQGNFIFDNKQNEYWDNSMLIMCKIENKENIQLSYIPTVKKYGTIRLAKNEDAETIKNSFTRRSEEIQIPGFIDHKYTEFASLKANDYLSSGFGIFRTSLFGRVLNQLSRSKIWGLFYKKSNYLSILNNLECEAHYELFKYAVRNRIKSK